MKISILIPSGILLAVYWANYFFKDRKKGVPLSVPLAFTCLFIPKVNLIHVNRTYSTAGIRTDDLLALLLLIVAVRDACTYKNKHIWRGIILLIILTAANMVSIIVGLTSGLENAIPYCFLPIIRRYEYFAFALIGIYITRRIQNAEKTALNQLVWMSSFHVIIGLLQVARLCNVANSGIITNKEYNGFAISTFNGNYEFGLFLCLSIVVYLFFFLRAYREKAVGRTIFHAGMILISLIMIVLTKSRTSFIIGTLLIAMIILVAVWRSRNRILVIVATTGIALCLLIGTLFATGTVKVGRFSVVNFNEYAEELRMNVENADLREYVKIVRDDEIQEKKVVKSKIKDKSAAIRFNKWGAALVGFREFPVFGYGTGVTHVIDGNYVKLLAENGVVGLLLWLIMYVYFMKIMWKMGKHSLPGRCAFWMMAAILMASVFLDMFEASKPMEMLWLTIGLVIALDARRTEGTDEKLQGLPETERPEPEKKTGTPQNATAAEE